jgi:polysaccharide export outer membrane protein
MKNRPSSAVIAVLVFSLYSAAGAAQEAGAGQTEKFVTAYKIGPKDLLEIKVREDAKLNVEVRVSEQGKINLAIINEVLVEGLTAVELQNKLAELYALYLNDPHVAVTIKEHQSKQVSLLGAVAKPGPVQLLGRMFLLEAISAAGGLTKDAAREIIILRTFPDGTTNNLRIPIDDLMIKGDPKYNLPLEPGDNVIVQVDRMVAVYVYGQVKTPGALAVLQSRIPTLTQAIAQAGGFTERAAKRRVVVTRKDETGKERTFEINVARIQNGKIKDFQLQESDVVYIPDTIF